MRTLTFCVPDKVQGVWFRVWTQQTAQRPLDSEMNW